MEPYAMTINIVSTPGGERIMRGEGLRPVIRYARQSPCIHVRVDYSVYTPSLYAVTFTFEDGSKCLTKWNDWRVLMDWLTERRTWSVERVWFAHPGILSEWHSVTALRKRGTLVLEAKAPAIA